MSSANTKNFDDLPSSSIDNQKRRIHQAQTSSISKDITIPRGVSIRSVSQDGFVVPVNTCFSAKGSKGKILEERKVSIVSPGKSSDSQISNSRKLRQRASEGSNDRTGAESIQLPRESSVNNNENFTSNNRFFKRKRYSYPLLGGFNKDLDGVDRLPLSPVKAKRAKSSGGGNQQGVSSGRCVSQESKYDLYDPLNSVIEAHIDYSFEFQQRRHEKRLLRINNLSVNNFNTLPDEMMLKIFGFLPKRSLYNCLTVCERWNKVTEDESLWKNIDAIGRFLTKDQFRSLLEKNPIHLRLSRAYIACVDPSILSHVNPLSLKYLDLSMTMLNNDTLATFLSYCKQLTKLSLESIQVTSTVICGMLSFAPTIETLNMSGCSDLNFSYFSKFLQRCKNLKALNLGCVEQSWSEDELLQIIRSFPRGIVSLNMAGFISEMKDKHVEAIAEQVPGLVDLDLSDSQHITQETIGIILRGLPMLETLGLSRCYKIEFAAYSQLGISQRLRSVQMYSIFRESAMKNLQEMFKNISFNQHPTSPIARPTVGDSRSSIWGVRVRDYY